METPNPNRTWLFCPKCGETIPEIYFSNSNKRELLDFRCLCELKNGYGNSLNCITSLDPDTYLKYCEEASSSNKIYCLHCKKWLNADDVKLHKKLIFTYPHLLADCEINIGSFCEQTTHYHPNQRVQSKFYCETHALHICSTCYKQYHDVSNGVCVVYSLETMRKKINDIYINLKSSSNNKDNKNIKSNDNNQNKVPSIFQIEMRDFFVEELLSEPKSNFTESVRLLLYHLFNIYFYISESHFSNYNLAKSILNLSINANDKQITLHPASINYYQVMNYYPKKNNIQNEKSPNKADIPFLSQIQILNPVENIFQFVFINDNTFKVGEIYSLNETNHQTSFSINEGKSEINKDKQIEKKLGLELNYKPLPNSIKLIQFIKMDIENALATLCRERDKYCIKKFMPIINETDKKIIGYQLTTDFSMTLKSDFEDFRGLCEYTAQSKEQYKKEGEWKCLCFGNLILRISHKENKKFAISTLLRFKDIFKDEIWKNFTHFMPFPINDESSVKLLSIDDSVSKTFVDTIHLIVEKGKNAKDGKNYSKIHSFVLVGQDKPSHFELHTTSTPEITSICYLEKNIIAVGGIDNIIEMFPIDVKYNPKLTVTIDTKKSEKYLTHHQRGIYCIAVINNWFISGGGNGSLIIWSIEKRAMLNIIYDDIKAPVTSIMNYKCPFGPNTLMCCYEGKGINFWASESDSESRNV